VALPALAAMLLDPMMGVMNSGARRAVLCCAVLCCAVVRGLVGGVEGGCGSCWIP